MHQVPYETHFPETATDYDAGRYVLANTTRDRSPSYQTQNGSVSPAGSNSTEFHTGFTDQDAYAVYPQQGTYNAAPHQPQPNQLFVDNNTGPINYLPPLEGSFPHEHATYNTVQHLEAVVNDPQSAVNASVQAIYYDGYTAQSGASPTRSDGNDPMRSTSSASATHSYTHTESHWSSSQSHSASPSVISLPTVTSPSPPKPQAKRRERRKPQPATSRPETQPKRKRRPKSEPKPKSERKPKQTNKAWNWFAYPNGITRRGIGRGPALYPNDIESGLGQALVGGELISLDVEEESEKVEEQALVGSASAPPVRQRGQKRGRSTDDDDVDDPTPRSKRRISSINKNNPKGRRTVAPCPSDGSIRATSDPSFYLSETYGSLVEEAIASNHSAPNLFTQTVRRAW